MGTYNGYYKINTVDLIDIFYPVGTIYETENANFNPQTVWGGTWVKIEDKFLVAAGSTYTGTGGAASQSITLSTSNLPSHRHSFTPSGSVSSTFTGTSKNIEGSLICAVASDRLTATGSFTSQAASQSDQMIGTYGTAVYHGKYTLSADVTPEGSISSTFTGTAGNTDYNGSGAAFTVDTVPPYQAVYIWKRTA